MDIKTLTAIVASVGAVAGVGATFWNSQIQLEDIKGSKQLRQEEIATQIAERELKREESRDKLIAGERISCHKWEAELKKLMTDKYTGKYTMILLQNISQAERDSYHALCKGYTGFLYKWLDTCIDQNCWIPRFDNGSINTGIIVGDKLVWTGPTVADNSSINNSDNRAYSEHK